MDDFLKQMAQIQWPYADKDLAALTELEKRITEVGRREEYIFYSDLVKGVTFHLPNVNGGKPYEIAIHDWTGLDRRIIGDFLAYGSYRSYEKYGFMVNVLVVDKENFRPSWNFFQWLHHLGVLPDLEDATINKFWIEESKKAHDWFKASRRNRL